MNKPPVIHFNADEVGGDPEIYRRTLYRYSVEYARGGSRANAFVRGCDEKEARAQFKAIYPGADIEHITSLGKV